MLCPVMTLKIAIAHRMWWLRIKHFVCGRFKMTINSLPFHSAIGREGLILVPSNLCWLLQHTSPVDGNRSDTLGLETMLKKRFPASVQASWNMNSWNLVARLSETPNNPVERPTGEEPRLLANSPGWSSHLTAILEVCLPASMASPHLMPVEMNA